MNPMREKLTALNEAAYAASREALRIFSFSDPRVQALLELTNRTQKMVYALPPEKTKIAAVKPKAKRRAASTA